MPAAPAWAGGLAPYPGITHFRHTRAQRSLFFHAFGDRKFPPTTALADHGGACSSSYQLNSINRTYNGDLKVFLILNHQHTCTRRSLFDIRTLFYGVTAGVSTASARPLHWRVQAAGKEKGPQGGLWRTGATEAALRSSTFPAASRATGCRSPRMAGGSTDWSAALPPSNRPGRWRHPWSRSPRYAAR